MEALIMVNLKGIEDEETKKLAFRSIWKILDQSNQGDIANFFSPPEVREMCGIGFQYLKGRSPIGEDDLVFFRSQFSR